PLDLPSLSLHDAFPISPSPLLGSRGDRLQPDPLPAAAGAEDQRTRSGRTIARLGASRGVRNVAPANGSLHEPTWPTRIRPGPARSEEHTSELQSRENLV